MRPVDLAVIAIYFAVVPAIGFHLKRFDTTGEDFFMAGRGMTAWIAGLSFIPANPGSLETMGWAAFAGKLRLGAGTEWVMTAMTPAATGARPA